MGLSWASRGNSLEHADRAIHDRSPYQNILPPSWDKPMMWFVRKNTWYHVSTIAWDREFLQHIKAKDLRMSASCSEVIIPVWCISTFAFRSWINDYNSKFLASIKCIFQNLDYQRRTKMIRLHINTTTIIQPAVIRVRKYCQFFSLYVVGVVFGDK